MGGSVETLQEYYEMGLDVNLGKSGVVIKRKGGEKQEEIELTVHVYQSMCEYSEGIQIVSWCKIMPPLQNQMYIREKMENFAKRSLRQDIDWEMCNFVNGGETYRILEWFLEGVLFARHFSESVKESLNER